MFKSPIASPRNSPEDAVISVAATGRADDLPLKSTKSPSDLRQLSIFQGSSEAPGATKSSAQADGRSYERPSWHRGIPSLMNQRPDESGGSNSQEGFFSYPASVGGQGNDTDLKADDVVRNGHDPAPRESSTAKERRLRALQELCLGVSDIPFRRETFDQFSELAKSIFKMSTGMVSIIGDDVAMIPDKGEQRMVDFDVALCAHVLNDSSHKALVVHDITQDLKIRKNPLWQELADEPIEFYAGVPLVVPLADNASVVIGTLCVLDTKPRPDFDRESATLLAKVARTLVRNICAEQAEYYAQKAARMHAVAADFIRRAILPDPATADVNRHSNDEGCWARGAEQPTGRFREGQDWDPEEVMVASPLVEPEDENETEDDVHNAIYEQALVSMGAVVDDAAIALLDVSGYRIFLRDSGSRLNDDIHQRLTDDFGVKGSTSNDMGNRLSRLDARLQDVADEDIVVKKILRSETEERDMHPEVLSIRLADVAYDSPFQFDATQSSEFTDGICDILLKVLKRSPSWFSKADNDPTIQAIFRRTAPGAHSILAHPLWHPDGTPLKLVLLAWQHEPFRKDEVQSFVGSLMTGLSAALTLHRARRMEKAQLAFSQVQAHELRTPIHQIRNMASLLKGNLTDYTVDHKREFEEGLKNVEEASIQLEAVMLNILSYFELESDFSPTKVRWEAFGLEKQAPRSLEVTLNDVTLALATRDADQRTNNAERTPEIEVILEIIPPFLGESVQEDVTGNFARAIGNIITNALGYIQEEGYVLILVDDVPSLLPPQGFADISTTKNISIKIIDSGMGMNKDFLVYDYFRPMAKGNDLRAGSGLSVHVARRLLKTLGGSIAVSSQPGKGTTVHIEVPLWRKRSSPAITASLGGHLPDPIAMHVDCIGNPRNVYLLGFFEDGCTRGQRCAGEALIRSVERLGCKRVNGIDEADIVFVNIRSQNRDELQSQLRPYKRRQVVCLFKGEQSRQEFNTDDFDYDITCLHRPILPSSLRLLLFQPEAARKAMDVKPPRDLKAATPPPGDRLQSAITQDEQQTALPPTTIDTAGKKDSSAITGNARTIPVVVVEDNRINRKILVQYLKKMNIQSREAVDGEEALTVFQELHEACIVLLDINMPKMDGFAASTRIRELESHSNKRGRSQIIAITALSGDEHRNRGLNECGMDEWLVKPTNRNQIQEAVQRSIRILVAA